MNRTKEVGSVFGNVQRTSYDYMKLLENKYNLVYCYRSSYERENKKIPMKRKIRKLLLSVKDDGCIYVFYYLAKNENDYSNFSRNQYLRLGEMKEYFDFNNWDIIFNIEGHKRMHGPHPFHNKEHYHNIGVLILNILEKINI